MLRSDGTNWVQTTATTLDSSDVLSGLTQLNVDNLRLDGNILSSTNSNGNINLIPNGTGAVGLGQGNYTSGSTIPIQLTSTASFTGIGNTAIGLWTNNANGPGIAFIKSRSTSIGASGQTIIQNGDEVMRLGAYGSNGSGSFTECAQILTTVNGAVSGVIIPTQTVFKTTNTGGTLTTAMTISNAQVVTLANALPVTSGGTGLTSTTVNQILYSSATSTIAGLATANNGLLVTSNTGVPSILGGPGTTGQILQSNAAAAPSFSTASFPSTSGTSGTILRSNGTNWVNSTATFADTYTASNLLYSNGANTVTGLATANNGVLITSSGGVPSISSTLPSGIAATNMNLTTPTLGVASATSINFGGSALSVYSQSQSSNPVVTFGTNGDLSVSYAVQTGYYTKIGNIVLYTFTLQFTPTYTTSSGSLNISIPFTSLNQSNIFGYGSVLTQSPSWTASATSLVLKILANSNTFTIAANYSGGTIVSLGTAQIPTGVQQIIEGYVCYLSNT
jgi:hypothetical protein